jgi:hypothetical protein
MGENTDISGASSAVDFSSVQKIKPPRVACALTLGLLYAALGVLAWAGSRFSTAASDFKLPVPGASQLLLHFSGFLQSPVGMAAAGMSFLSLFLLLIRGSLDRIIKIVIAVNVLVVVGLVLWSFAGFFLPLVDPSRSPGPK